MNEPDADVLTVFHPVGPDEPQWLMRQVSNPPKRWQWCRGTEFELGYYPNGRNQPSEWIKTTKSPERELPYRMHTTDWGDHVSVANRAWEQHDNRFIAWTASNYIPS